MYYSPSGVNSMAHVIYKGPSALNGATIRVCLTGADRRSKNTKTGDMVTVWYLPENEAPHHAVKSGSDGAVCGDCPLRDGACYVSTFQAPRSVWQATNGAPVTPVGVLAKPVRFGGWGDPASAPEATRAMLAACLGSDVGWTGYTHQWRRPDTQWLRRWIMASTENDSGTTLAHSLGWRTFRARPSGAALRNGEIHCPSPRVSCAACQLCRGDRRARNISIEAHGSRARVSAFGKLA